MWYSFIFFYIKKNIYLPLEETGTDGEAVDEESDEVDDEGGDEIGDDDDEGEPWVVGP